MKVLYDYQGFLWTTYGGIPRYFTELITEFRNNNTLDPVLPQGYCQNSDYRELIFQNVANIPFSWKVRDSLLSVTTSVFHKNPIKYITSVEKKCKYMLATEEYDIFHPTHFSTYYQNQKIKAPIVLTVHDFTIENYSEYYSISKAAHIIQDTKNALKLADRVICISEYTKKELPKFYDVDPDIIDVVYHGPPLMDVPPDEKTDKYKDVCMPYLLYVGSRVGNKNFYSFLHAIRPILQKSKLKLVCAGSPFTAFESHYLDVLELKSSVLAVTANNEKLMSLYRNAVAFVFPSINEGFGLPVLEAFSCGCPVICSNTSSFPEIGGDAAEYFNPKDIESIREAILNVVSDEKIRANMKIAGYNQLEKFSWKKCADETKAVYEKAIGI